MINFNVLRGFASFVPLKFTFFALSRIINFFKTRALWNSTHSVQSMGSIQSWEVCYDSPVLRFSLEINNVLVFTSRILQDKNWWRGKFLLVELKDVYLETMILPDQPWEGFRILWGPRNFIRLLKISQTVQPMEGHHAQPFQGIRRNKSHWVGRPTENSRDSKGYRKWTSNGRSKGWRDWCWDFLFYSQ